METLSKAFRLLLKLFGAAFVGSIALVLVLVVYVSWSDSNKERASYECVLRRMDNHIAEESTGVYQDTCMAAMGYERFGGCASGNLIAAPAFCFAPAWRVWR
ncbi:hypothetical protein HJA87_12150 [Rhizobium bangladeshense]|uniref:DUF1190 domain-containing protein n=1 Tax=Rhizobium bangladeshense TaxID=1138189 RepID=A0ABS7LHB4_9HYPH|nr:hypothetical protein [Rhizobium bangladeshense]MBY3590630.1 hypothetical protein [Rhizobium bangladeshense]